MPPMIADYTLQDAV